MSAVPGLQTLTADALLRAGAIRSVDHALAQLLRRHGPGTHPLVLAGAALAAHAVSSGHAAFDPARPHVAGDAFDWPTVAQWRDALRDSPWVAHPCDALPSASAPLVFEHGLLYLRRYREHEQSLAHGLHRIAAHVVPASEGIDAIRDALFPPDTGDVHQRAAADAALVHALLLVTGGPGTGKTTTIARVLALLVAQALHAGLPAPRIAMAAPTGRAAERMATSLRRAVDGLRADGSIDAGVLDALPTTASTLHRLLGPIPDTSAFRHDAAHPLAFDVVVVDEASMIDLPLMARLVDAIDSGSRLILLGDADQLPSVEAGDVLAAMVDAAAHASASHTDASAHHVSLAHVHLQRGYRQSEGFDLAPLAHALRDGDADHALHLLRSATLRGVHLHDGIADPLDAALREQWLPHWRALASIEDPALALREAARLRLLCAVREGPAGVRSLNARIDMLLAGPRPPAYYPGRLLLVTENSPRHGLSNGDIGVCIGHATGMAAWFETADGPRAFHPATLPTHEGAFAMTVHKAQGSEFDQVWLVLPPRDERVLSRALLYTGATRARESLHVLGTESVLRAAMARTSTRVSALSARLSDAVSVSSTSSATHTPRAQD